MRIFLAGLPLLGLTAVLSTCALHCIDQINEAQAEANSAPLPEVTARWQQIREAEYRQQWERENRLQEQRDSRSSSTPL